MFDHSTMVRRGDSSSDDSEDDRRKKATGLASLLDDSTGPKIRKAQAPARQVMLMNVKYDRENLVSRQRAIRPDEAVRAARLRLKPDFSPLYRKILQWVRQTNSLIRSQCVTLHDSQGLCA